MSVSRIHISDISAEDRLRFLGKIEWAPIDQCWIWTGAISRTGYGQFWIRGRYHQPHRIAVMVFLNQEVLDELHVCHHCDNRRCVNPSHLFLGTARENSEDMVRKGRSWHPVGELHPGAKLSLERASEIRLRVSVGESQTQIAREFGVSVSAVHHVVKRRSWISA